MEFKIVNNVRKYDGREASERAREEFLTTLINLRELALTLDKWVIHPDDYEGEAIPGMPVDITIISSLAMELENRVDSQYLSTLTDFGVLAVELGLGHLDSVWINLVNSLKSYTEIAEGAVSDFIYFTTEDVDKVREGIEVVIGNLNFLLGYVMTLDKTITSMAAGDEVVEIQKEIKDYVTMKGIPLTDYLTEFLTTAGMYRTSISSADIHPELWDNLTDFVDSTENLEFLHENKYKVFIDDLDYVMEEGDRAFTQEFMTDILNRKNIYKTK